MAQLPRSKTDYSLEIRYRLKDGSWSDWLNKGSGTFQDISIVQKQIRLLASQYQNREKEIRFEYKGKLCGFDGSETGEVIRLD